MFVVPAFAASDAGSVDPGRALDAPPLGEDRGERAICILVAVLKSGGDGEPGQPLDSQPGVQSMSAAA
jgi:hypothetical protein